MLELCALQITPQLFFCLLIIMAARSTGMFPREGFDLDENLEVTTSDATAPVTLKFIKTIRVILIGAAIAGDGDVTVNIGGKDVSFGAGDLDLNGVGIAHVRGVLCDADNLVKYTATPNSGTATVTKCYLDMVDG